MAVTKIAPSTPIREFPDIYNRNVDELVDEIDRLRGLLAEKDTQISTLISNFNKTINSLDAKYQALFSQKMAEFEDTFVKISEFNTTISNLDNKFVKKEDNQ